MTRPATWLLTLAGSDWTDVVFLRRVPGRNARGDRVVRRKIPRFAPGGDNILDFVTDNKYIFTGNNFFAGWAGAAD